MVVLCLSTSSGAGVKMYNSPLVVSTVRTTPIAKHKDGMASAELSAVSLFVVSLLAARVKATTAPFKACGTSGAASLAWWKTTLKLDRGTL